MKQFYYKLIRDRIPEKMLRRGVSCDIFEAKDDYVWFLRKKLMEESREVYHAKTRDELIEELADVVEVFQALKREEGIKDDEIREARRYKAKQKGRFQKRLILRWSKDN